MARDRQHNLRLVSPNAKGRKPAKAKCHFCIVAASFTGAAAAGALVLSAVWWLASSAPAFANLPSLQTASITGGLLGAMVAFLYHYLEALDRDLSS